MQLIHNLPGLLQYKFAGIGAGSDSQGVTSLIRHLDTPARPLSVNLVSVLERRGNQDVL